MPPASYPVLILSVKGDVVQGKLTGKQVTDAAIQAYYKKKLGAECIGTYPYKALTLFIFAATAGPDELENKHQLPPPHDGTPFYGDILLLASKDENSFAAPVPFKPEDYETFYTKAFGGFDSDEEEGDEGGAEDLVEDADDAAAEDDAEEEAAEEADDAEPEDDDADADDAEDDAEDGGQAAAEEDGEGGAAAPGRRKRKATAPAAPKKRKAAAKSAAAQANGSAYPDRPILSEADQLHEELIPTEPGAEPENRIRATALRHLRGLFDADTLTDEQVLNLERCIYNAALREATERKVVRSWDYPLFVHLYKMVLRRIACNFSPASYVQNGELFTSFQAGQISLDSLSSMNTYDLYPSRWKDQFDQQQQREKRQLEGNKSMATDQFLCTRCWKRECTYYEMQTRSADEPMTIFITCLNCGKHWRQ